MRHLREWRRAAQAVAEAAKDLDIGEVYVVGGAAEGRLTVLSDVDILICAQGDPWELRRRAFEAAVDRYGLPWDYPLEIHVATPEQCRQILARTRHVKVET